MKAFWKRVNNYTLEQKYNMAYGVAIALITIIMAWRVMAVLTGDIT